MSRELFDEVWYLRNNQDVAAAVEAGQADAWTHFDLHGRFEGRSPSPFFDPAHYLAHNADVANVVEQGLTTAYDHFLQHGVAEDRSFVPYFDAEIYLQNNTDVAAAVEAGHTTAVQHFLTFGQAEIRTISPFFNMAAYLDANPDVANAVAEGASPLAHMLTHGFAEGRDLGNGVSLTQFANDPTFQAAIESRDPLAALARVAEVAPFIPTFQAPEGWVPAPNTPIPVNFVPLEGEKLVVPPSVEVPDDVELPEDVFEPVEPGEPGEPDPGEPDPTFTVTENDGVITFGGSATGDITVTLVAEDDATTNVTFTRDGIVGRDEGDNEVFPISDDTVISAQDVQLVAGPSTVLLVDNESQARVFENVAEAVQNSSGGTVIAGAGNYDEQVVLSNISSDLAILGSADTVLDGSQHTYAVDTPESTHTGDVTIDGVTALAGSRGGIVQGYGTAETGSLTVSNSVILPSEFAYTGGGNAILVSGANSVIESNEIVMTDYINSVGNWATSGVAVFDYGSGTRISSNTIRLTEEGITPNNSVTGVGLDARYEGDLEEIVISENAFDGLTAGITSMDAVLGTQITGNEFIDNGTAISFGTNLEGWDDEFGATRIEGNAFRSNDVSINFAPIEGASEFTITGNSFDLISDMEGAISFSENSFTDTTVIIDVAQFALAGDMDAGALADNVVVSSDNWLAEAIAGFEVNEDTATVAWDDSVDGLSIQLTGVAGLNPTELFDFFGATVVSEA